MPVTIAIKLDPARMKNPDADLRYLIPDHIQAATDGRAKDDGYDYLDDDAMVIFLAAETAECLASVLEVLAAETFCDNRILDTAVIGIDAGEGYTVVYPAGYDGAFDIG
jgi:hypothetical protein